jgi:hypothetical protein
MVFGTLWGFQPVFRFRPWGDNITIRAYGGLAFDFRICLLAWDVKGNQDHQQKGTAPGASTVAKASEDIFAYMWGGGRWIFPFIGAGMDFKALGDMTMGFDLRVWFPLWKVWTGEKLPFVEGLRFGVGFRAAF